MQVPGLKKSNILFFDAVRAGEKEKVKKFLTDGVSIEEKLLLEDRFSKIKIPYTALAFAAEAGNVQMLEFLLENKAQVTPLSLELALRNNHFTAVRYLLTHGGDPDKLLYYSVLLEKKQFTYELIEKFNANVHVNDKDRFHDPILVTAAFRNDDKLVSIALDKGADPNIKRKSHESALHYAVKNKNYKMVQELIKKGSKADFTEMMPASPLHFASMNCDEKISKALLNAGASMNSEHMDYELPIDDKTPLQIAQKKCDTKFISFLKKQSK